jgi:hypothetical protein
MVKGTKVDQRKALTVNEQQHQRRKSENYLETRNEARKKDPSSICQDSRRRGMFGSGWRSNHAARRSCVACLNYCEMTRIFKLIGIR